jgi:hypothetical protein
MEVVLKIKKSKQDEMQITTNFNLIWILSYIHSSFKCNVF